jgi:hypothetical protein
LRRKLLLLNLVLLLLTAAAGWQLRREWLAARAREEAVLKRKLQPAPAPPVSPMEPARPVMPAGYAEIAQKMLFVRDRNPNVVVEAAPAPPPKPMPPKPVLRGVMNLGDGPIAIMAEKSGAQHREYRKGDMVGEFRVAAIGPQEVVLEWEGKTVTRTVEQMAPAEQAQAPAERTQGGAPPPAVAKTALGPGNEIAAGTRACQPNDSNAAGAVVDGFRKIVVPSPFGESCRWEAVK